MSNQNELIKSEGSNLPASAQAVIELLSTQLASKLNITLLRAQRPDGNPREPMNLAELMDHWVEKHGKPHCKRWAEYQKEFNRYLSALAQREIHSIKRADVLSLQSNLLANHGKSAANAATDILSMLYNRAIEWELFEGNSPASRIRRFKIKARERFLQPHELAPWFAAVQSLRNETTRDLLLMLLFTGARRRNTCEMRWDQISFELRTWRIEETKNGDSQLVPLIAPAFEILKRRQGCHPVWVFPKQDGSGPVWSLSQAWAFVLERANIEGLQIHDLRRSMGSWEAITGASLPIIGRSLNHKNFSSTQIYAKLHLDPVRDAMNCAVEAMFKAAGVQLPQGNEVGAQPFGIFDNHQKRAQGMQERTCSNCGNSYRCRERSRSLYCRNYCKQQAKRKGTHGTVGPIKGIRRCNFCGLDYTYRSSRSKFCSAICCNKSSRIAQLRKQILENKRMPAGQPTIWDGGLGIRPNKKGSNSYLCRFTLNGRQVLYTLGRSDQMTLAEAKQLVAKAKAQSSVGIDPRPQTVQLADVKAN